MEIRSFIGHGVCRSLASVTLSVVLLSCFWLADAAGSDRPEFAVSASFSSHLPVLVIERNAGQANADGMLATVSVHSGSVSGNSPIGSPSVSLDMRLVEEPDQAGSAKKSYSLSLAPEADLSSGAVSLAPVSLAGLPEDTEWRLQGSARDKGMLRNGLAYTLGRGLFPDSTPEIRYCEVLVKTGDRYQYEGRYILAQSLESRFAANGKGTLVEYSPADDKRRTDANSPGGDETFLGLTLRDRGFSFILPREGEATQGLRMETAMDGIEGVLHSLSPDTFLTYSSMLDERSAIDLYFLNVLLLNDKAGPVPFYLASEGSGRFHFQPVWRFDQAVDNTAVRRTPLGFEGGTPVVVPQSVLARKVPVWRQLESGGGIKDLRLYPVYAAMGGDNFLWFDRLFLSRPFLKEMLARYHELKRGLFSPANLSASVDTLAAILGPALERDWNRWQDEYAAAEGPYALAPYTDAQGERHIRRTLSYDQELVKLRYVLSEQTGFLMERVTQMNLVSGDLFDTSSSGNRQAVYAFATIIAFLFLTHFLTRKV